MRRFRKVRRGREIYERLVARREAEGLTWKETARAGGVPLATLMEWAARLRREPPRTEERGFVELEAPEGSAIDRIEVVLRTGRRLLVSAGFSPAALAAWIEVLERPC
jgi:transcriptional regulator with XRE-family HTH domain